MASDIQTRLKIETSEFDSGIKRSKEQIRNFQKSADDTRGSLAQFGAGLDAIKGSLGKLSGVLGLAGGASAAFMKTIESNQTMGDKYENTVNAMKESVDNFFFSLGTGDWSAFNNGITGAITNAFHLSEALDELNDKKLSFSYIKSEDMRRINELREKAYDTDLPAKQRLAYAKELQTYVNDMRVKGTATYSQQNAYISRFYKNRFGLNIGYNDLDKFYKTTNFSGEETKKAQDAYKKYNQLNKKAALDLVNLNSASKLNGPAVYSPVSGDNKRLQRFKDQYELSRKQAEQFKLQNIELIKQGALAEVNDKTRKKHLELLTEENAEMGSIASYGMMSERTISRVTKQANKTTGGGGTKGGKTAEIFAQGSIGAQEKYIQDLKKSFQSATNDGVRQGLYEAIKVAENELTMMTIRAQDSLIGMTSQFGIIGTSSKKVPVKGGKTFADAQNETIAPPAIADKQTTKNTDKYVEQLGSISELMGAISGNVEGGAAQWLKWGANMSTALSMAIVKTAALTAVDRQDATAQVVGAAAASGKSAASIPVVGWILAIGAIASVFAALASAPKFASGGIVGGSSFLGDNIYARVNSGEMVLNAAQQRNIASRLSPSAQNINVTVDGHLRGQDIYYSVQKVTRDFSR